MQIASNIVQIFYVSDWTLLKAKYLLWVGPDTLTLCKQITNHTLAFQRHWAQNIEPEKGEQQFNSADGKASTPKKYKNL